MSRSSTGSTSCSSSTTRTCPGSTDILKSILHAGPADLVAALDRLPRGATSISDFSPHIEDVIERAWIYGTLMFGDSQVRTAYLVVGFLNSELRHKFLGSRGSCPEIKVEALSDDLFTDRRRLPGRHPARQ